MAAAVRISAIAVMAFMLMACGPPPQVTSNPTATPTLVPTSTTVARDSASPTPRADPTSSTAANESRTLAGPRIRPLPRDGHVGVGQVTIAWEAPSSPAGIAGYAFTMDQMAAGEPPRGPLTAATSTVQSLADGDWFFHIAAMDWAGTWSSTTTTAIHIDTVPIEYGPISLSAPTFNPSFGWLTMTVAGSKPVQLAASVVSASNGAPTRSLTTELTSGKQIQLDWNGRNDRGEIAAVGDYRFSLRMGDDTGRLVTITSDPFKLTSKRIVVSITQQTLVAYDGEAVVVRTPVTTGGPYLPTPTGTFHILGKYSPLTMTSPWPKGSPYWFPDSRTQYAMWFLDSPLFGYYIHDAPWRKDFGPGSNLAQGTPGEDETGTHGCVNVPDREQAVLFPWTPVGTPVIIQH